LTAHCQWPRSHLRWVHSSMCSSSWSRCVQLWRSHGELPSHDDLQVALEDKGDGQGELRRMMVDARYGPGLLVSTLWATGTLRRPASGPPPPPHTHTHTRTVFCYLQLPAPLPLPWTSFEVLVYAQVPTARHRQCPHAATAGSRGCQGVSPRVFGNPWSKRACHSSVPEVWDSVCTPSSFVCHQRELVMAVVSAANYLAHPL
jgi:hypothetical protein